MTNEQKIDAIFELCKGLSVQEIYELSQILLRASLRLRDRVKENEEVRTLTVPPGIYPAFSYFTTTQPYINWASPMSTRAKYFTIAEAYQ